MSHSDLGFGVSDIPVTVRVERPWVPGTILPPDVPVISDEQDMTGIGTMAWIIVSVWLGAIMAVCSLALWVLA